MFWILFIVFPMNIHVNYANNIRGSHCYDPHFTDYETEAQRD